jgi:threonine synthase
MDTRATHLQLSPEREQWRRVAACRDRPAEERIEALETVIESEVLDTPLVRANRVERESKLGQVYLKLETHDVTGTHCVRAACALVLDALTRGYAGITVGSRDAEATALAFASWLCGMRCTVHVPAGVEARLVDEILDLGAAVVRVQGGYEATVGQSREFAALEGFYDANPSTCTENLELRAYGQIAHEVYSQLHDAPGALAAPVCTGPTLAGVHRAFASLERSGKTSRVPRIVAGSPEQPAATCKRNKRTMRAVRRSKGWFGFATDTEMTSCSRMLRDREGIHVSPVATAGLVALLNAGEHAPLPPDRYVVVLADTRRGQEVPRDGESGDRASEPSVIPRRNGT